MAEFLSDLERKVLALYLDGQSYQEISEELNRHVKSIDNALQRVKRKLERYLEVREISFIILAFSAYLSVPSTEVLFTRFDM